VVVAGDGKVGRAIELAGLSGVLDVVESIESLTSPAAGASRG
jgi:hypothetical protein